MRPHFFRGFSLIEVMISVAIAAVLITAISGVISQAFQAEQVSRSSSDIHQQAQFAMQRMVTAVRESQLLLIPMVENPNTVYSESVRNVLAVTLSPSLDRDRDGFADADNDKDGRINEDTDKDITNDGAAGIIGIDDDNDGVVDEGDPQDDDEDGVLNEDQLDGVDNDNDGAIDEDFDWDMNGDAKPGVANIDDDNDGAIDEGNKRDDDEDGLENEDWLDVVVFRLDGGTLKERMPNINPVNGADFTERVIAENVSLFEVTRLVSLTSAVIVDIKLEITHANGEKVNLNTRLRVGGAQ